MTRPPFSVLLAIAGLVLSIYYIQHSALKLPAQQPLRPPAQNPYQKGVAAVGIVESIEKNRRLDPFYAGRVAEVYVVDGQEILQGDPLYRLDTQAQQADLATQEATIQRGQATLNRLSHLPRSEDIAPVQARVKAAETRLMSLRATLARYEDLAPSQAISQNELTTQRYAVQEAQATLEQAQGDLSRLKAGAWRYELQEARAEIGVAQEQAQALRTRLRQSVVYAPLSGRVLQVNVRPGQWVTPNDPVAPVLLGQTRQMQIRVDVDEVNASRITPGTPAVASLKGMARQRFPLEFVRVEPYMVPKKSLTGDSLERNDVRVLQIIYRFEPPEFPVYVGQQVEVFIREAEEKRPPRPDKTEI